MTETIAATPIKIKSSRPVIPDRTATSGLRPATDRRSRRALQTPGRSPRPTKGGTLPRRHLRSVWHRDTDATNAGSAEPNSRGWVSRATTDPAWDSRFGADDHHREVFRWLSIASVSRSGIHGTPSNTFAPPEYQTGIAATN